MKNSNDHIGNPTCGLPPCTAVPQPTVPLCTPLEKRVYKILKMTATIWSIGPESFVLPLATQSVKIKIYGNIILPFVECAMEYSENDSGGA